MTRLVARARLIDRYALSRPAVAALVCGLAVLVGAMSASSPTTILTLALGLLFCVVALVELAAGVALFAALVYLGFFLEVGDTGQTLVRPAGAVLAVIWLLRLFQRPEARAALFRLHPALGIAVASFSVWGFVSLLWATDVAVGYSVVTRIGQGVLLFVIVFSAMTHTRHLWWLTSGILFGAVLTSIVGLAGERGADGRLGAGLGDANELASGLVPALALALFALTVVQRPLARWLLTSSAVVIAFAVFQTESRGGVIALGAVLVASVLYSGPVRTRAIVLVLLVVAFSVGYYTFAASDEARDRVLGISVSESAGRTDLWQVALEMWHDRPWLGVGVGNFTVVEPSYATSNVDVRRYDIVFEGRNVTHNSYLQMLAEQGMLGLLAFATVIIGSLAVGVHAIRGLAAEGHRQAELLGRGLLVATVGVLAAITFISALYEKHLWLLLGATAALSAVRWHMSQAPAESRTIGHEAVLAPRPPRAAARRPI